MMGSATSFAWHGWGARVTGYGFERHFASKPVSVPDESATYVTNRCDLIKQHI